MIKLGLREKYLLKEKEIESRLMDFKKVAQKDWFYELCFCIMAVQTSGLRAGKVAEQLKEKDFFNQNISPNLLLRKGYIRFHNRKTKHLIELKNNFSEINNKISTLKNITRN